MMERHDRLNLQAALNERSEERIVVIAPEPDDKCDLCGKMDETRPYGPNGENVCFGCGMKDRVAATQRLAKALFGQDLTIEEAREFADKSKAIRDAASRAAEEERGNG